MSAIPTLVNHATRVLPNEEGLPYGETITAAVLCVMINGYEQNTYQVVRDNGPNLNDLNYVVYESQGSRDWCHQELQRWKQDGLLPNERNA